MNGIRFGRLFQGMSINHPFFSGSVGFIYSEFYTLLLFMVLILAVVLVSVSTMSCILFKKRNIAIMRAIGTLPGNVHGFYLLEVIIVFLVGFITGLFFGIISFLLYSLISSSLGFKIFFDIDIFYTLILFLSCLIATIMIPSLFLMKLGKKNITHSFSKGIPLDYDASFKVKYIPKFFSRISYNLKIAVSNTIRRKGDFNRYLIVLSITYSIIFTIFLGAFVLSNSSRAWIHASQGENVVAIGHQDTLAYYSLMYEMFSNPNIIVESNDINFSSSDYLINRSNIEDIYSLTGVQKIDERLIHFVEVEERKGYIIDEYREIGQNRSGTFPVIGVNSSHLLQDFVMAGEFFTDDGSTADIVVGDGLAFSFFDSVFDQKVQFTALNYTPEISGYVIDSFYNGFAIYMRLDIFQTKLNLTGEINLILLKLESGMYDIIKSDIDAIINNLGSKFSFILLDTVFNVNLRYLSLASLYPLYLIIILTLIGMFSFYNYQKGGLYEKAKDFSIMKAIGAKKTSIKKIIFSEGIFVIVPSMMLSLSVGMLLNALILFEHVVLPPLYVPLIIIFLLSVSVLALNYLSMLPLAKKISQFSIKNFEIY